MKNYIRESQEFLSIVIYDLNMIKYTKIKIEQTQGIITSIYTSKLKLQFEKGFRQAHLDLNKKGEH